MIATASTHDLTLAGASLRLAAAYTRPESRDWLGSPFAWLLGLPPADKGFAGRDLVAAWFAAQGVDTTPLSGRVSALYLPGEQVAAVKCSLRWVGGGYKFQQIRDWNYATLILLGLSPDQAHLWLVPRAVAWTYSVPQHGSTSRQITVSDPARPPGWLARYGGTLDDAAAVLQAAQTGGHHD